MKLFHLKPIEPWEPPYDKTHAFVIRAKDEAEARDFASEKHGDEGPMVWRIPSVTTCTALTEDGPAGVIIDDYSAG